MGAPLGNQNGRNARIFRDSLHKVLTTYESKDRKIKRGEALDAINKEMVEQSLDGIEWAIKEVANRTDGKPVQVQEIYGEITARSVVAVFRGKLGDDGKVRVALIAAGADNLLPVLDQLMIEQPLMIEHETAETAQG